MQLSEQAQAILLLTAWLGKQDHVGATPLSPSEWGRFALFLRGAGHSPADVLQTRDLAGLLTGFEGGNITTERVSRLLGRSAALSISLEKWERAGLWVLTRSDAAYPFRWKRQLKNNAPPVLFGAGNVDLLNRGGIAVVGSRDLTDAELSFTDRLGRDIAGQGQPVISGGARGADEAAMLGALASDGMAVGVLADSLLRAATSTKYRKALMRNDLALVSPFNPEAGFNAGNAMARNKYIYCLSSAAIVIAATENKGGTWAGAMEDIGKKWVPLWVRQASVSGNHALVRNGANWLPDDFTLQQLTMSREDPGIGSPDGQVANHSQIPLPDNQAESPPQASSTKGEAEAVVIDRHAPAALIGTEQTEPQETAYTAFLRQLYVLLHEDALSLKQLERGFELKPRQLSEWLKQAGSDGVIAKTRSPVKYRLLKSNELVKPADEAEEKSDQCGDSDIEKRVQSDFEF
ncbi:DNA-processing protein DprA [Luteibacter sp. ME-Dv--P-043b]|uniref:DNA-processing protein DprA n=1 Tax=Luteibacter sp. ME-Dv--P-043b TaxID=3040291 RepID=UPI0025559FF6|nr:DNA-processing protein DprA [Luteibacter sp. ME-Dv--P-043b]